MPRETILHEDEEGRLSVVGNALIVQDKNHENGGEADPVELRFHSENETIGKWSVCAFRAGRWREIGLVMVKRDERGRTNPAHRDALEIRILTHIPGRESFEDADYQHMFSIRHDGIVLTSGAVLSGAGGAGGPVTRFYTDGGQFVVNWQDDTGDCTGIVYATHGSLDESTWTAVGRIPVEPL